ncbi:DNA glycosylase AlkZ-like family protein [Streptomyces sp. NPDC057325]|uniref:DNA glycosylase AlkZ-like family protein n=1 Tax=unclassified Streptomyces TaxID=2593676 RepID=UPI00363C3A38
MNAPAPPPRLELSLAEARSIAVAAALPAGGFPDMATALAHLRIVQIDSINVLAPAHHLTLTTRIPGTTTKAIDSALNSNGPPIAFDYPAHAIALVPLADWPLWAFRRRASRRHPHYPDQRTRTALIDRITLDGPLPLRHLRTSADTTGTGWNWNPVKTAVELLVWSGELTSTQRTHGQRLFDLPDRCIPSPYLTDQASDDECLTQLLTHAGAVLGVGTTKDLADYLRIPTPLAARLLPTTPLTTVQVEDWGPAWADPCALTRPAKPHPEPVFLNPFDNLIWHRPRVQRLFDFTHVFEAYKPAARRTHGYYVCPLLADGHLIGRADFARHNGALTIQQASLEPHAGPDAATTLARSCQSLAAAIGHDRIELAEGAADPTVTAALRSTCLQTERTVHP